MIVYRDIPEEALKEPVLTVGMFDGVHRGHQALIDEVCSWAGETGGTSVILTFTVRPPEAASIPSVTTIEKRISLIENAGVNVCIAVELNDNILGMDPMDFIHDLVMGQLGCRRLVAGVDWKFGRDRAGGNDLLARMREDGELDMRLKEPVVHGGVIVSSTAVRAAVAEGDLDLAEQLLGRRFSLSGEVVHGSGRGADLGFPTANVNIEGLVRPPCGVYAAWALVDGRTCPALASLGTRPTFGETDIVFEMHLLDFEGDVYGDTVEAALVAMVRREERFSSEDGLRNKMEQDAVSVRQILA